MVANCPQRKAGVEKNPSGRDVIFDKNVTKEVIPKRYCHFLELSGVQNLMVKAWPFCLDYHVLGMLRCWGCRSRQDTALTIWFEALG